MFSEIHANDYGYLMKLTIVQNGVAVDISSYTTRKYLLTDPGGTVAEKTVAFDDDGLDGVLTYTVQAADIDEGGSWKVQARLEKTGVRLTSQHHTFHVYP
jgi:hypothetical protein